MLVTFLVFAAVFLIFLALAVIYLYPGSGSNTTIPGLDPSDPKEGNVADIGRAGSLHEFLVGLHEKFGEVASFWMGQELVVSLGSPKVFKEVSHLFDRPPSLFILFEPLITKVSLQYANGAEGRKRRNIYDASFSHSAMTRCYETFQKSTDELVHKLASKEKADEHIPLMEYMFALAIKNIALTTLGLYFKDDKEVLRLRHNYDVCWSDMESRLSGSMPEPNSVRLKKFDEAADEMRQVIMSAIKKRRKDGAKPGEHLFIDAVLESGASDDVIYADALTYLIGGFHTTGLGLTWALYFLASHQEVQTKVVEEIKSVLGDKDVSPDVLNDLRYLKQVLNETFRCSILAPMAARFTDKEIEVGGHKVPPSTPMIISLGTLLQDEQLFKEPNKFDPDRFEEEAMKSLPNLAFEPFGFAGKRKCPGYRFAFVEMTVVLVTLLRKFKFELVEGQVVIPEYGLVTKPKEEIWVTVAPKK